MQMAIVLVIVIAAVVCFVCRVIKYGVGSSCGCCCTSCGTKKIIAAARKKYPVGNVEKPCAPIYRGKGILPREKRTFFLRQKFGVTKNILHG